MSNEKELKQGNDEVAEIKEGLEEQDDTVEGYNSCSNFKQKCLQDCFFDSPSISTID